MKKVIYAAAALAMTAMVSCNDKEEKIDTSGAVPAKVINTMTETSIIISEDSTGSHDTTVPSVAEAVPDEVAAVINEEIEEENKEQNTDKEADTKEAAPEE